MFPLKTKIWEKGKMFPFKTKIREKAKMFPLKTKIRKRGKMFSLKMKIREQQKCFRSDLSRLLCDVQLRLVGYKLLTLYGTQNNKIAQKNKYGNTYLSSWFEV